MNQIPNDIHITLLLLTKNEQDRVGENLKWLGDCPAINEILVVDDNSEDKTVKILKKLDSEKLSVKVFPKKLEGDFSAQRQFGLTKASNNWVLWLDADETPSPVLITFLNDFKPSSDDAVGFIRQDTFMGQKLKYTEASNTPVVRLFDKDQGKFVGLVHEVWKTPGSVKQTNLIIHHYPHPNLKTFWQKINLYSTIRAQELYQNNTKINLPLVIIYPLVKFISNYFLKGGFREGTVGIIFSLTMSFHSFLTRAKLWHLYQR